MRCKCCNSVMFEGDIVWRKRHRAFEELCKRCIRESYPDAKIDEDYWRVAEELNDLLKEDERDGRCS